MKGLKGLCFAGLITACLLNTGCRNGGLFHRNQQQQQPPASNCPPGTTPACVQMGAPQMAAPMMGAPVNCAPICPPGCVPGSP